MDAAAAARRDGRRHRLPLFPRPHPIPTHHHRAEAPTERRHGATTARDGTHPFKSAVCTPLHPEHDEDTVLAKELKGFRDCG